MGSEWQKTKAQKGAQRAQKVTFEGYMAKAFYASPNDLARRTPELQALAEKTVAVFGLGCLGGPSVLEFARAGIRCLRLVDHDIVDPATTVRWPLGFMAAGQKKVKVLQEFIRRNYPYTECEPFDFKLGSVREPNSSRLSDQEFIAQILENADLIYDSTAEIGVQNFLTDFARDHGIAYIGVSGTLGGWGGKVFRIRVGNGKGCWFCYRIACCDGTIPEPPTALPERAIVQPVGCADPTFTGAGFDMLQIAIMGVRMAISTLCEGSENAYPVTEWDVVHISLRSEDGSMIAPKFDTYKIESNPECRNCHGG